MCWSGKVPHGKFWRGYRNYGAQGSGATSVEEPEGLEFWLQVRGCVVARDHGHTGAPPARSAGAGSPAAASSSTSAFTSASTHITAVASVP